MSRDCKKLWKGAMALVLAATAGCYSYKEPAVATFGESYTQRQKDVSDDMFKDITTLSLRDAQRIAIQNNPTYIAAYHAMEAARLKYLQAWGAYSPTITASFGMGAGMSWNHHQNQRGNHPRYESFNTNVGVQANLLIFDGFARMFRLKAAKSGFNYQARMEEDACRTMMLSVSYAYNTVLLAKENQRIALADKEFQTSSLENTKHKFNAGAAPLSDVLNFEIYVKNAEVSKIDADYQYEIAVYALAQLMGYPEGKLPAHVQIPGGYSTDFADLPPVEVYLDAALANRPDLKAYREQLNIAKYQVYQAWGAYSPTVSGYFNWGTSTADKRDYPQYQWGNDDKSSISYGINVEWTVFNGAIRLNQLREAKASQAIAEYNVAAQWFHVVGEVRTAYANYVQNVRKTKHFKTIKDLSEKQRGLVQEEYKAGKAELTRLNEAQRDLVEAETSLASSYVNVQNAKAQLVSVVGGTKADFYMTNEAADGYPGLAGVQNSAAAGEDIPVVSETANSNAPAIPVNAVDNK